MSKETFKNYLEGCKQFGIFSPTNEQVWNHQQKKIETLEAEVKELREALVESNELLKIFLAYALEDEQEEKDSWDAVFLKKTGAHINKVVAKLGEKGEE